MKLRQIGSLLMIMLAPHSAALYSSDTSKLYNHITSEMIDLRKKYPAVQQKIYAMLDWTNKLYKTVGTCERETDALKQKLAQKEQEIRELKESAKKVKDQAETSTSTLASIKSEVTKQLDDAHARTLLLERENKDLQAKLQTMQLVAKEADGAPASRKDLKA